MKQPDDVIHYHKSMMGARRPRISTAEGVALIRAAESRKPEPERICYDPYAIRFVRSETLTRFRNQSPEKREADRITHDRQFPGQRNSIAVRVRFFDEIVKNEIASGTRQIVIIGAGYDSRAYRIEGIRQVRIFEVDRPELQQEKKAKVIEIFGSLPVHVTYVLLDLSSSTLIPAIVREGFNRTGYWSI